MERRHALYGMRAADGLNASLGQTEVLDLAFPDQVLDRSRYLFYRHVRVDAMLIEEIDGVDLEPFQGGFGDFPDVFGPAVQARLFPLDRS